MNDDNKKFLKEKLSALANDEELDNVAGGTGGQNWELIQALSKLDPDGVHDILAEANKTGSELVIANGIQDLIQKHFGGTVQTYIGVNYNNDYLYNGAGISHNDMMGMIQNKVNQKALENEGWVIE